MAVNYVSVSEKNLAKGLNQLAAEDDVPEGFVEDAINVEVSSGGYIQKRQGYVSHLGELPLRASSVSIQNPAGPFSPNTFITFPTSVSITSKVGSFISVWLKPSYNASATSTFPLNVFTGRSFDILSISPDKRTIGVSSLTGVFTPFVDSTPNCVVYGLSAEQSHSDNKENWVHHLDSFVSTGGSEILRTLVCGYGSEFFSEQTNTSDFLLPVTVPVTSLKGTINSPIVLQPGFSSTASSSYRYKFDGGGEGWAIIESITFNSTTNLFDVLLSTPNVQYTLGSVVELLNPMSATYNRNADALTLKDTEFSLLNGQHTIHSQQIVGSDQTLLSVYIQTAIEAGQDLNCGATGLAGIFTQSTSSLLSNNLHAAGDRLFLPLQPSIDITIHASSSGIFPTVLQGVIEDITIIPQTYAWIHNGKCHSYFPGPFDIVYPTAGMTLNYKDVPYEIKRTGFPLFSPMNSMFGPPSGPLLTVVDGQGVIKYAGFDFTALLTEGETLRINSVGIYSGEYTVTYVSPTQIGLTMEGLPNTFLSYPVGANVGIVFFEDIDLSQYEQTTFVCEGLWLPIVAPQISTSASSIIPTNFQKQLKAFASNLQPTVRSTAVNNTLYLNNGTDEPLAFDGFAIRRAGLFPWTAIQTVEVVAGTALASLKKYRYYARLEYVDQNGQLYAGNTSGANDFKVTAPSGGGFSLIQLSPPPLFSNTLLEWDRIFVSLYRTQADDIPFVTTGETFHLIERIPVSFNQDSTSLLFIDKMTDSVLANQPSDNLIERTRGLSGSSLQLAGDFTGPPRALLNTTLNSRLFLANSRDYPSTEITFSGQYDWSTIGTNVTVSLFRDGLLPVQPAVGPNHLRFELRNPTPSSIPLTAYSYNGVTGELTVNISAGFPGQFAWVWDDTSANKQVSGFFHMRNSSGQMQTIQKSLGTTSFTGTARFLAGPNIPVPLFTDNLFGIGVDSTGATSSKTSILFRIAALVRTAQQGINRTFPGWASFTPFMTAVAGNDLANTEAIRFELPAWSPTTPAVLIDNRSQWGGLKALYARGQTLTGQALLLEEKHISRVHYSFPDFPETFSVAGYIDVNAADGQAITGVIPFFSTATNVGSGAGGQEATLVVFKTNSVYLLKVNPNGTTALVKLETQGLGCTAPYSIAPTNNGIMFANETGIYRLGQNNQIEPIGRNLERLWKGLYNTQTEEGLEQAYGHHFGTERTYRLSLPLKDSLEPTDSLAYNHTNEGRGELGAWSRHTQMPFLQWCNLLSQEYVATTRARVMRRRNSNTRSDYVDMENLTIPSRVDTRMTDFGDPSTRKRVLHLTCTYRTPINRAEERNLFVEGTTVALAINQSYAFNDAQEYVSQGNTFTAGLSDRSAIKADTVRYSLADTKSSHFQARIENNTLYSAFELNSISYRVAGLTTKGETEAVDTSTKAGRRVGYISGALTPRRN